MTLRKDIVEAMMEDENNNKRYNTRLANIADMAGASEDDVNQRMESLSFTDYVELMRAARDRNEEQIKDLLGLNADVEEAYSGGGTLSPGEMRANKSSAGAPTASTQTNNAAKAQSMQRLGKKNLGGATGQQAADALDKASQGKTLTPVQRKAMAAQASSVDALASDPKTATQFRNLLNKINNK
jgi:hypothetical protein